MVTLNRLTVIIVTARKSLGPYAFPIGVLTLVGFLGSLVEGIGVGAMVPLIAFVIQGTRGGSPPEGVPLVLLERFFSLFGAVPGVRSLLVFVVALFVLKTALVFLFGYLKTRIVVNYETSTSVRLYRQTLYTSWPYLLKQKIGHLQNALVIDVSASGRFMHDVASFLLGASSLLVYTVIALFISATVTVLTLALGGLFLALAWSAIKRTRRYAQERLRLDKRITHYINEHVIGLKTIKAMHLEGAISARGAAFFEQLKRIKVNVFFIQNVLAASVQPFELLIIAAVFAISYKSGNFEFASFAGAIYLAQRIFAHLKDVQQSVSAMHADAVYFSHVLRFADETLAAREKDAGTKPFAFAREIRFDDVHFAYAPETPVLSGIMVAIPKGTTVGIVGMSGVGKTTIVDLLLRFFAPQSGVIRIDGTPIDEIALAQWRSRVGYVSQELFLTNDTVRNNIAFYDATITDERIVEAARAAHIHDVVTALPKGYDTVVGERGTLFSQGQRQRIVLARVLARRPDILILDEATSALDNESEVFIKRALDALRGGTTMIVIAHRISTVKDADRIIVLEGGRIREEGSPRALLQDESSQFYKLYHLAQ